MLVPHRVVYVRASESSSRCRTFPICHNVNGVHLSLPHLQYTGPDLRGKAVAQAYSLDQPRLYKLEQRNRASLLGLAVAPPGARERPFVNGRCNVVTGSAASQHLPVPGRCFVTPRRAGRAAPLASSVYIYNRRRFPF